MFTSSSSTFSLFLCQPSFFIVFLSGGCIRSGLFCRSLLLSVHCCWCHPSHLFSFFGTDVGLLKAFVSIRLFCFPDCLAYWSVVFLYCLVVCFFSPFFFARCFDNNFEIVLLPWCYCRFLITCLILLTEISNPIGRICGFYLPFKAFCCKFVFFSSSSVFVWLSGLFGFCITWLPVITLLFSFAHCFINIFEIVLLPLCYCAFSSLV